MTEALDVLKQDPRAVERAEDGTSPYRGQEARAKVTDGSEGVPGYTD